MTWHLKSKASRICVSFRKYGISHLGGLVVRPVFLELFGTVAIFFTAFLALNFSIQNFRIDGTSMDPTIVNEQHIVISKLPYIKVNFGALKQLKPWRKKSEEGYDLFVFIPPSYGEVIAFNYPLDPSREFMKRVIGLPGDTIEIDKGWVIRNGKQLVEPYVRESDKRSIKPVKVPENSYYVLGDNRSVSNDSRNWGAVQKEFIIGRAWFSYWPSGRIRFIHSLW